MSKEVDNPFKILGLDGKATTQDIAKAFRTQAKKYHPDLNKSQDAKLLFSKARDAYEMLKDQSKREQARQQLLKIATNREQDLTREKQRHKFRADLLAREKNIDLARRVERHKEMQRRRKQDEQIINQREEQIQADKKRKLFKEKFNIDDQYVLCTLQLQWGDELAYDQFFIRHIFYNIAGLEIQKNKAKIRFRSHHDCERIYKARKQYFQFRIDRVADQKVIDNLKELKTHQKQPSDSLSSQNIARLSQLLKSKAQP